MISKDTTAPSSYKYTIASLRGNHIYNSIFCHLIHISSHHLIITSFSFVLICLNNNPYAGKCQQFFRFFSFLHLNLCNTNRAYLSIHSICVHMSYILKFYVTIKLLFSFFQRKQPYKHQLQELIQRVLYLKNPLFLEFQVHLLLHLLHQYKQLRM